MAVATKCEVDRLDFHTLMTKTHLAKQIKDVVLSVYGQKHSCVANDFYKYCCFIFKVFVLLY